MFTRLRKFLGNVLGNVLYVIGWGFAVIVLAQAIILSVTTGNPLAPVILGAVGVIFFLIAVAFKYVLAGRKSPP